MATIANGQKFLTSAPEVNTTYGGSTSLKELNTWYTMQDIAESVQPYKVFTALLTQSGGDNFQSQSSGSVQKGVTYFVDGGTIGLTDFSNVGGQFQTDITGSYYFIATVDGVPNEYGGATADYNTGAPVATVLENTIGNIWFTYDDTGIYSTFSNDLFIENKSLGLSTPTLLSNLNIIQITPNINNMIITTINTSTNVNEDGLLNNTPIEIRVYN